MCHELAIRHGHVTVLVDGAPEILPLTLDIHEEFIQMPNVAQATLSSLECSGIFGTELQTPRSDALEADCDIALRQEIFNISEAQAESVVKPNRMADDTSNLARRGDFEAGTVGVLHKLVCLGREFAREPLGLGIEG